MKFNVLLMKSFSDHQFKELDIAKVNTYTEQELKTLMLKDLGKICAIFDIPGRSKLNKHNANGFIEKIQEYRINSPCILKSQYTEIELDGMNIKQLQLQCRIYEISSKGMDKQELIKKLTMHYGGDSQKIKKYILQHGRNVSDYPIMIEQYSDKNNRPLTDYSASSNDKVWWICKKAECGCLHEWQASIRTRAWGTECPYCSTSAGKVDKHKSFAYLHPDMTHEWSVTNDKTPDKYSSGSDKQIKWRCSQCEHLWTTSIKHRTIAKSGCPNCNGKFGRNVVTTATSFLQNWKGLVSELHPTKNKGVDLHELVTGSVDKLWWLCPIISSCGCIHEYEQRVYCRTTANQGCPWCDRKKTCYHESLAHKHDELLQFWDYSNVDNPDEVYYQSQTKYNWICKVCEHGCVHSYTQSVRDKTVTDCKCPCYNKDVMCIHNSVKYTHPNLVEEFSPDNDVDLRDYRPGSAVKVNWTCPKTNCTYKCAHNYEMAIYERAKGRGCPFCVAYGNAKQICVHNSLEYKYPKLMEEWDYDKNTKLNITLPGKTCVSANVSVWWICRNNPEHRWKSIIQNRTDKKSGCPHCCKSKHYSQMQIDWLDYIMSRDNISIQYALSEDGEWCVPRTRYKADGFCEENNTVYEFHGDYWHGNPNIYPSDEVNAKNHKTYGSLHKETLAKQKYIEDSGYNYECIWEQDWKKYNRMIILMQRRRRGRARR
jgi:hypothetical protein